jgi:uncharacterized delta-60 repeat protein
MRSEGNENAGCSEGQGIRAQSPTTGLGICRLLSTGAVDTSFGVNGFGTTPDLSDRSASAFTLMLDHTGRFVVMGKDESSQKSPGVVARFTATGLLDTSFASRGYVLKDFSGSDGIGSIWYDGVALANDQILLTGTAYKGDGTSSQTSLTRFTSNGAFDSTYAGGVRNSSVRGMEKPASLQHRMVDTTSARAVSLTRRPVRMCTLVHHTTHDMMSLGAAGSSELN